jgi:hypothetical protein
MMNDELADPIDLNYLSKFTYKGQEGNENFSSIHSPPALGGVLGKILNFSPKTSPDKQLLRVNSSRNCGSKDE